MDFVRQLIPEIILIKPIIFGDERGYFMETFKQREFESAVGHEVKFVQDNESKSKKGVLRGLHFQLPPFAQSKLVRVIQGEVLDVAVDIRHDSPTFGKAVTAILNDKNKHQLFIPRGFAHGFIVLSDEAIFSYKVDNYYSQENDRGISYDDPQLSIDWKLSHDELQLSSKDQNQPELKDLNICFEYGVNYYA